jgi:hypothetical protein
VIVGGPERVPAKVSSRTGSRTTPTTIPSLSWQATLTENCGIPKRKLTVPSRGSTTQRRAPSPL